MALNISPKGLPDWTDPGWGEMQGSGAFPDIGMEDSVSDKEIVDAIQMLWDHEYEVRRPHQITWERAWDRFNNKWSHHRKREWQSKRGLPVITVMALKFAWEMTKAIEMAGGTWFEATSDLDPWKPLMDLPRDFLLEYLETDGSNPEGDFLNVFYDAMVGMSIMENAHILVMTENEGMVDWTPTEEDIFGEEDPFANDELADLPSLGFAEPVDEMEPPPASEARKQFRLKFEALHPRMVLLDTSGGRNHTYKMWYQRFTPWQFREYGEAYGWQNVEEILEEAATNGDTKQDHNLRDARERGETVNPKRQDHVELTHFFGTCPGKKGSTLFKNSYCSKVGPHIVSSPVPNLYWHGQIPIISCGMVNVPWSNYHLSLLTLNLDPQEARVELLNLLLDYLQQVINPPTEIDWDQLHQSRGNQVRAGIFPGQVIHVQKSGRNYPAVSRVGTPDIPSGVWQGLGFYKTEFSEGTGLADTGAMPRTRNRISAQEFKERQVASGGIWQQIFLNIERRLLAPILYQAYQNLLQKVPQPLWEQFITKQLLKYEDNPELQKKIEVMKKWGAKERWRKLSAAFRFKVTVYSAAESRREELEKVQMLTEMAQVNPVMGSQIRWRKVAEKAIIALEEDPNEYLLPEQQVPQVPPQMGQATPGGAPNPVTPVAPPPPGMMGG
jgi:hypothetical protein